MIFFKFSYISSVSSCCCPWCWCSSSCWISIRKQKFPMGSVWRWTKFIFFIASDNCSYSYWSLGLQALLGNLLQNGFYHNYSNRPSILYLARAINAETCFFRGSYCFFTGHFFGCADGLLDRLGFVEGLLELIL